MLFKVNFFKQGFFGLAWLLFRAFRNGATEVQLCIERDGFSHGTIYRSSRMIVENRSAFDGLLSIDGVDKDRFSVEYSNQK